MCVFIEILGSGKDLAFQLVTFFTILVTMGAWIYIFIKGKLGPQLKSFILPIALWFAFGTLDILVTARGTFDDPMLESNPATRFLLVQFGHWGAPVASVLWICLWAGIVYALNSTNFRKNLCAIVNYQIYDAKTKPGRIAEFVSLAIFYSLAVGHFFGFSSWFAPLCGFAKGVALDWLIPAALGDWKIIVIGTVLAGLHLLVADESRRNHIF